MHQGTSGIYLSSRVLMAGSIDGGASRARFKRSTFIRGSPRIPSWRPSVWLATSFRTLLCIEAASRCHPVDLNLGPGGADMRIEPAARGGHQIYRDGLGLGEGSDWRIVSTRALTASRSAGLSGPRLEPLEAAAL